MQLSANDFAFETNQSYIMGDIESMTNVLKKK